ncbi:hypothetical protein DPMN_168694 [Dreissena polymorpha]|uniref:Ig-like domain-containing protein n=1 Tax=Dreissena polymorpha TaxID=45954 RepID=A0A9D4IZV3_DREPO|nr:hypothetical protein DPMN_168694 [Dreissena polymorpha]
MGETPIKVYSPANIPILQVINKTLTFENPCENCTSAELNFSTGFLAITLYPLANGDEGTFQFRTEQIVLHCVTVYLYGKPSKPTIKVNNANKALLECDTLPVILSCSSWSTTAPSGHGLQMLYTWLQNEDVITTGGRFELASISSNTLTISEVYSNDTTHPFTCVATEQGANLSDYSNGYSLQINCECPTIERAFIRRGEQTVLNFTTSTVEDRTISVYTPRNGLIFQVNYASSKFYGPPWFRNCTEAPTTNFTTGVLDLLLYPVTYGFEGTYKYITDKTVLHCISVHLYGEPTKPSIQIHPSMVLEGGTVTLSCNSFSTTIPSGQNLKIVYSWKINDNKISPFDRFSLSIDTFNKLTISNVQKRDMTYSFSCIATEDGGDSSVESNSYAIEVQEIQGR